MGGGGSPKGGHERRMVSLVRLSPCPLLDCSLHAVEDGRMPADVCLGGDVWFRMLGLTLDYVVESRECVVYIGCDCTCAVALRPNHPELCPNAMSRILSAIALAQFVSDGSHLSSG